MISGLLRDIRGEVIELLFNRHVFRTHQEIVRRNPHLQEEPRLTFAMWSQRVYGAANSVAVRRLGGTAFESKDVNLVRFLEMCIQEPEGLWPGLESCYNAEANEAKETVGELSPWESLASRHVLRSDLKLLRSAVEKLDSFTSKSGLQNQPSAGADAKFRNLDRAIEIIKRITEKYTLIVCLREMRRLPVDKPSGWRLAYDYLDRLKDRDLFDEMKSERLQNGWDQIFLEPWATKEVLSVVLGETRLTRSPR